MRGLLRPMLNNRKRLSRRAPGSLCGTYGYLGLGQESRAVPRSWMHLEVLRVRGAAVGVHPCICRGCHTPLEMLEQCPAKTVPE